MSNQKKVKAVKGKKDEFRQFGSFFCFCHCFEGQLYLYIDYNGVVQNVQVQALKWAPKI